MAKTIGQIECPQCSRVAEIREQANGQKIPYLCCKKCGMTRTKNEDVRQNWLDTMKPIGELGEYGQILKLTSNETSSDVGLQHQTHITSTSNEWTPPEGLEPEKIEPEQAAKQDAPKTKSKNWGFVLKAGVAIIACAAFGAGAYKLSAKNQ